MKKHIQGFGGGGKSGGGGTEQSDTLRSIQYAVFIDAISEGPIRGLVNGMQSVYFDQVPLQNPDGSFNFVGAFEGGATNTGTNTTTAVSTTYYATSNGDLNGPAVASALAGIPGMNGAEYESNVSVPITNALPHTERITASNVDHVRVTIGFEGGLTAADSNGNINGASVEIAIDLQNNGAGFVTVIDDVVTGKSSSKYQRSYVIPLSGTGPFDVRVRRVSADTASSLIADKFTWETYTGIISTQLAYPHTAWAAFRIDASQFSGIPTRGYDMYGLIIQVPSNYDPVARTYTGTWDGTFKLAWSNNPAWVFYDMVTNARYGLGDYISASMLDKWNLYAIAQYCDVLVDNGQGGQEPRFVCNLYIQGQSEAYKVLQDLTSIFNSITYWGAGSLLVSQDAPSDAVAIFNNANVIDGIFSYQGSSIKARHTVALVGWNDPSDFCKQKIEYVQDDDGVRKYGVIKSDVKAFGCTSRGQAHRFGRAILFGEKYETEVCTFRCGMDGTYLFPGAIIQTSDLTRAGKRMGGRIVSATSTSVVMDATFAPVGGMSYSLIVIGSDGSVMIAGISSFSGSTVALSQSLDVQALAGAVFIISESDIQPEMWRVVEVSESAPNVLTVSCMTHNPSKYGVIENGLPLAVIPTSNINLAPGQVSNILLTVGTFFTSAGVSCLLSWNAASNATSYTVSWAASNGLSQTDTVYSTSLDIACLQIGVTYSFSITANSSIGVPSSPVFFSQEVLAPNAPAGVGAFSATASAAGIVLAWTDIGYPHLYDYEIRFGSAWGTAAFVGFFNGTTTTVPMLATGTYTWLIKARDVSLTESVNPVSAALTIGAPGLPTSISATGGYQSIYLAWTNPAISNYAYTEIFESATSTFSSAASIAQISGNAFTRSGIAPATQMYYWLRTVNNVQPTAQTSAFSSVVSAQSLSNPTNGLNGSNGAPAQTLSISGFTGFSENAGGAFAPTSATLGAVLSNVSNPVFAWTVTGGTPTSGTSGSITVTPNNTSTSVTAAVSVTGSNLSSALTQSVTMPISQAGAAGQAGANGIMSAVPTIYQWTTSSTAPTAPTTPSTYTWSSGTFAAPSGWSSSAPTNTTPGNYLWQIECFLTTSATTVTSSVNWTTGTMAAVSYNGANGSNGANGTNGTNGSNGSAGANGSAAYLINRGSSSTSGAPSTGEVLAAVGRAAVTGDIATVLYNSGNNAASFLYTAGSWAAQSAYITGSLIVQNTITANNIAAGTITGTQIAANSITASNINSNGLSIKDASGNVILSAGSGATIQAQIAPYTSGATVGATWGSNISSIPSNIATAGASPSVSVLNNAITVSGGTLTGIGTTGIVVDNSLVTATTIGAVQTSLGNAPAAILNNNVVAGGGNLYRNTDFATGDPSYFGNYNNGGATLTNVVSAGGAIGSANYWRITPTSTVTSTWGFLLSGGWGGWQNNVDYVWSFYARTSAGGNLIGNTFYPAWNHAPASFTWLQNPALTTSWQRYVCQLNFGANTLDANGFFSTVAANIGVSLDFSCIQIETGLQPSGWAPLAYINSAGNLVGQPGLAAGSAVAVANGNITISSSGALSGAGGGAVTIGGLGYTGALNANYTTNTNQLTDGANLGGTSTWTGVSGTGKPADNATVGATFGVNIGGQINSGNASTYIAAAAIGTAQIANAAITNAQIANAAVGTAQIATAAVTNAQIANATITNAQIASGTIQTANIGTAQVDTLQINGNAVTIPVSATGANTGPVGTTYTTAASVTADFSGAPVLICACTQVSYTGTGSGYTAWVYVYLDGVAIATYTAQMSAGGWQTTVSPVLMSTPSSGSHTYSLVVRTSMSVPYETTSFNVPTISAVGVKR